jgi:murein L,D-transpeptidase YcbB/YkuD
MASGRIVDPGTIQWQTVQAGSFPYALRQRAGPKNPLGRVKFMFPNPYSSVPARYVGAGAVRS